MKHFYSFSRTMWAWVAMLLVAVCALPADVAAQVSFRENFDYPLGSLYQQGGWVRYGGNTADPIQVVDKQLAYEGYSDGTAGRSVRLGATKSGEDLHARFTDQDDGVKSGSIYFSALVNVEQQPSGNCYVLGLEPRTARSVIADGTNPTELGRLYIGKADNDGEFKIGVERGGAKPVYSSGAYKLGQTYLVVLRYEIVEGQKDNVYLYVNPASLTVEPKTPDAVIDGANWTGSAVKSQGLQGIELRQGTNASVTAPVLYVAALRVADSYGALFGTASEDTTPKFKASKKSLVLGEVYTNDVYEEEITVTGTHLTGSVSVESDDAAVTVSPAELSAADVMGGDGAKFTVRVKCSEGAHNAVLTLKSEGAEDARINVSWTGFTVPEVSTIKALYGEDPEGGLTYRYSGEAVVTFVDNGGDFPVYYLQDATGAIPVGDDYGILQKSYSVGDRLTGFVFGLQKSFGTLSAVTFNTSLGTVVSTGNDVQPADVALAELSASPADYVAKLVRVKGVAFKNVAEGATFAAGMAQPVITDGVAEASVRVFKKTSLIGTAIPSGEVELTGISTSAAKPVIGPRGAADIVAAEKPAAPEMEVSPAKFDMVEGYVGKSVEAARFHVSAKNLPGAVSLELTYKNFDMFELSTESIAKGSSETDVVVYYKPTAIGKHTARVIVDCPSVPELAQTITLNAYAIDEQNPPVVSAVPSVPAKFEAKVGETQQQTLEITTANLPYYANVKVKTPGTFVLGTTMLMPNAKTNLLVTFKPNAAGSYSNAIVVSALGMADVEIPLEGVASADQPAEPSKEGDELKLSADSPVTLLNETFDNLERNKPFHISGWTNAAVEGTRAWWGYSFLDSDDSAGEHVAKVTAYDSKVEDGAETPAQMLLVTPALDFKNAESKMFTFRVRGDYLQDNQTDKLELVYIDLLDGDMYVAPVGGFTMPCTKDESGEWNEYHVDLTGLDLADTFFMGFRFTSTRGRYNAATYFIDDVTYGRTDIAVIRPNTDRLAFSAQPGKDAESDEVTVATENLNEPVKLSIGGANKSKFKLSATELPVGGGSFSVSFHSDDEGVHEAYVKLASRGAADKYIALTVNNSTATGIDAISADPAHVSVYDISGKLVVEKQLATPAEAVKSLPAGVYVVKTATADSIATYKVQLR